jgi:hypothetical protein
MNAACISWHCVTVRSQAISDISNVVPALEQKLLEEICEDILPLLQTFTVNELKTMYLLAHNVCLTDPKVFFKTTKSYFDQFLKEYDTSVPENAARFELFFPGDIIPSRVYGIGFDSTYTPIIQLLVQKDGILNSSVVESLHVSSLPISLQAVNVMNQLNHCGEALYAMLKKWKSGVTVMELHSLESAVQSALGTNFRYCRYKRCEFCCLCIFY